MKDSNRDPAQTGLVMRWGSSEQAASAELTELRARFEALENAHARCEDHVRDLMERNTSLVQLTVASHLLAHAADREQVLDAIEEIVVNMIGSEEVAIFEADQPERRMRIARVRGIDVRHPRFSLASAPVRQVLAGGNQVLPAGRELTAVVPLRIATTVYGAVAVFRLLAQKPSLDPTDRELMELLSLQGAIALFSATHPSLRPTVRPPPRGR
jgi:hypothetical protein